MKLLNDAIFAHPPTAGRLSDAAFVAAMIRVEAALALAQGGLGMVPPEIAEEIANVQVSGESLMGGVQSAGVPVPALLSEMRAALSPAAASGLHYGATSQDIVDTALSLLYRDAMTALIEALSGLLTSLEAKARGHASVPMLARTRGQIATPVSFALRLSSWASPLIALEADVDAIIGGACRVSLGGASGSLSALAPHGPAIRASMAENLGLADAPTWHSDRGGIQALAAWLTRLTGALGKMAGDVLIATRGEVAEMRVGGGGGSSTMPHKANPVLAEALRAARPVAQGLSAGLAAAAIHAEERDGVHWAVEWKLMPELLEVAGAALERATALIGRLEPMPEAMAARLDAVPGVFAEAAVFSMMPEVSREEATKRVKDALAAGVPLSDLTELPTAQSLAQTADEAAWEVFAKRKSGG
ncbi:MAG: lyase family protein [Pseudomonadota bacterium]